MRNLRIIENKNFYIQYQFMGIWFYARGNDIEYEFDYAIYTEWIYWLFLLMPIAIFPFFQIDNIVVNVIIFILFVVSCLLSLFSIYFLIISKKKEFYSKDSAINWIKKLESYEKERKEEKKEKKEKKKKGVNKLVGVYYNGELIEGARLDRWQKLEKIVGDDNDKIVTK